MDSTSVYKYRVKKRWYINYSGDKTFKFYPQYKSKLFSWRYMSKYTSSDYATYGFGVFMLTVIFSLLGVGSLLFMLSSDSYYLPSILFGISLTIIYSSQYYHLCYNLDDVKSCTSVDNAKKHISERISYLVDERRKKKKSKESLASLPDDSVFYLNLQVERTEKLKRLNKKKIFPFW